MKQPWNGANYQLLSLINFHWTARKFLPYSLHRHKQSRSTRFVIKGFPNLGRFAKISLVTVSHHTTANACWPKFSIELYIVYKVEVHNSRPLRYWGINSTIISRPRGHHSSWSQVTTIHLWTKLLSSKHDIWILAGNTWGQFDFFVWVQCLIALKKQLQLIIKQWKVLEWVWKINKGKVNLRSGVPLFSRREGTRSFPPRKK